MRLREWKLVEEEWDHVPGVTGRYVGVTKYRGDKRTAVEMLFQRQAQARLGGGDARLELYSRWFWQPEWVLEMHSRWHNGRRV